jgi:hypothetical protein
VPTDFPTIQSALDSAADRDTVLISWGTYVEAPVMPALSHLVVRGQSEHDSLAGNRPVIDPSDLERSNTLACLSVSGENPVIENIVFRNRTPMYQQRQPSATGGIRLRTLADVEIRDCLFDSVFYAIGPAGRPTLERCQFQHGHQSAIYIPGGRVRAVECVFSVVGFIVINCSDSSYFSNCVFRDAHGATTQMSVFGRGVVVEHCIFGPNGPFEDSLPFRLRATGGLSFTDNIIVGNHNRSPFQGSVIHIEANCMEPAIIENNAFLENDTIVPLQLICPVDSSGNFQRGNWGEVRHNLFSTMTCSATTCQAIIFAGHGLLERNRFHDLQGSPPAVNCLWDSASVFRDNVFLRTGTALISREAVDAKWNYWGDPAGPFELSRNPLGRGDSVSAHVTYFPWHPDTSFLATPKPRPPLPEEFALRVFPNPFNSTATIRLELPEPNIVTIELFDLRGRRVREIWSGAAAYEKDVRFEASTLASGIYFVRAFLPLERTVAGVTKIALVK